MRLIMSDPKAADVKSVKVDGKMVATAVEVDTDEGWVIAVVPDLPAKRHIYEEGDNIEVLEKDDDDPATFGWMRIKYTGNIEVLFNDA